MERWIRAVVVCLAVLLTRNGAVAGEKTADEIAIDHACVWFGFVDANGDGVATYMDYVYALLHVPLVEKRGLLVRDIKRQLDILKEFPWTARNFVERLLTRGISLDEFLAVVGEERHQPIFKDKIDTVLNFLFNVFNYDGDVNGVNPYELTVLCSVFNIPGAEMLFSKLDANGDKKITRDEATTAARGYFITAKFPQSAYLIGTCEEVRKRVPSWVDPIAAGRLVLSIDKFGSTRALIDLLRSDPALNALFLNLLDELLGNVPALVGGEIGAVSDQFG